MFANHNSEGTAFSNFVDTEDAVFGSLFGEEEPITTNAPPTTTIPAQPAIKYPELSLMGIPAEIRLQIFGHLADLPTGTFCLDDLRPKPKRNILYSAPASASTFSEQTSRSTTNAQTSSGSEIPSEYTSDQSTSRTTIETDKEEACAATGVAFSSPTS
ncbi:uncharacterized protein PAC_05275 [Phialocephala subalpina]|uniref:Uncharacterized protein n=1 Tax=Phialocephala subalpina TaxID=576137 RepID=A0A1L7WRJ2_9HELO|nr:uncharacterized protein PAC_05275 [Phialocephala subalpina]